MRFDAREIIRQLKTLGLSREDIASKTKLTVGAVRCWEKGEHNPNYATYEQLLQILNGLKKKQKREG